METPLHRLGDCYQEMIGIAKVGSSLKAVVFRQISNMSSVANRNAEVKNSMTPTPRVQQTFHKMASLDYDHQNEFYPFTND
jgi:hypothetical protein